MRDIWLVSDTHFFHENILKFTDNDGNLIRPGFNSVEEMNEHMRDRWNSVVKPGDIVYHLGDVMMGPKEDFQRFWPRLNGSKRLIVGNHDDIKYMAKGSFFQKIQMWRVFADHKLLLTHVPIHESSMMRPGMTNVHGHTHQNGSPPGPYKSVCVEMLDDYTPVHIDEVV
ncbi:MAG: hypothetical protein NXH70_02090 [Hyphomonas sp.]|nr:hypothetical protein [Hyphomonas sp.]